MTRVLHIIGSLAPGDVPEQLRYLAQGLPRGEYELHVCALRCGVMKQPLEQAGLNVTVVPQRLSFDPATIHRLTRQIASIKPDIVQTWQSAANTHGRIAAWRAGVRRLVAVERGFDAWKRWPEWYLDRRLAERTSRIVVTSPLVQDYYQRRGVQPQAYEVISDAAAPLAASANIRQKLLAELELDSSACLVGAFGDLTPHRRFKDLIWAIDILHYVYPGIQMLIFGDGPQRAGLMRYAECVEMADRIHFLGQRVDAPQMLASLDYVWHAAVQDAAALPVLLAQAAGVPVVAIDTPPHRALIDHGQTGFLAPFGERPAFSRWTHRMLEEPALRLQVIEAARSRVLQSHAIEQLIDRYRRLYESLT